MADASKVGAAYHDVDELTCVMKDVAVPHTISHVYEKILRAHCEKVLIEHALESRSGELTALRESSTSPCVRVSRLLRMRTAHWHTSVERAT